MQRRRGANLWSVWNLTTKILEIFSQEDIIILRKVYTELRSEIIMIQMETGSVDLWVRSNKLLKCFSAYLSIPVHVSA